MRVDYDPPKSLKNEHERGLSFERASNFDFADALAFRVLRNTEIRTFSVGYLEDRLHILCYVPIADGIRVISFRRANVREALKYGKPLRRNT